MDRRGRQNRMSGAGIVEVSMKQQIKKIWIILLCVCICAGLWACGTAEDKPENSSPAGTVIAETENTMTVVDQAGREVKVKKDPKSIALCYRVVVRFLLNMKQGDKITGIGKTEDFLEEVQPSLKTCMDVGQGVADIEALAELKPDLFFHKASDTETLEAVEEIGIPAVGIDVETPEAMITAVELMGKVCGAEERAEELIDFYNKRLEEEESLISGIKQKKTAILMGSSIGKVADGTMLQGEMIERAGGINCASELDATELWPTAGTEQIFAWNPDYIFITGSESAVYTAEDLLKDPAWSELKAVKEKHVYVVPSEKDSWEFPGIVSTLGVDYMLHTMYPERMSEQELEKRVDAFYRFAYGRTFSKKELGY